MIAKCIKEWRDIKVGEKVNITAIGVGHYWNSYAVQKEGESKSRIANSTQVLTHFKEVQDDSKTN